ncbi:MAG: hypothetical protein AABW85_04470 [archaeon]
MIGMDFEQKKFWEELIELNRLQLKLQAAAAIKGMSFPEKIEWLSSLGMPPKDIAEVLGTTPNTIRVAKSQLKRVEISSKNQKQVLEVIQ